MHPILRQILINTKKDDTPKWRIILNGVLASVSHNLTVTELATITESSVSTGQIASLNITAVVE